MYSDAEARAVYLLEQRAHRVSDLLCLLAERQGSDLRVMTRAEPPPQDRAPLLPWDEADRWMFTES